MKIKSCINPPYGSGLSGLYHAVINTDRVIPVPEELAEKNWAIRCEREKYPLFAGVARLKLKERGGMACLWGDSESEDAEFCVVKGGREKEYLVPVLLMNRNDNYVYHTRIVILDKDSEKILEPYDMLQTELADIDW